MVFGDSDKKIKKKKKTTSAPNGVVEEATKKEVRNYFVFDSMTLMDFAVKRKMNATKLYNFINVMKSSDLDKRRFCLENGDLWYSSEVGESQVLNCV